MTLADLDLDATLRPILASHAAIVAAWRRNEPGAWGVIAAQAILATHRALGRKLTEAERRMVWERMWRLLTEGLDSGEGSVMR
jgi:hypothetical protein